MTQASLTLNMHTSRHNRVRELPLSTIGTLVALAIIACLAAGLRLTNLDAIGDGNAYYTAAVKNMLQSPSNFFYVVADAGGVTVDKPPVALWIQAAFAAVFGVSGLVVTLPSIIAGTLSVLLLYHLVQKGFGPYAGLIAALALAVTPIAVAVDRTNNMDSILIFTLLLATWAFIRATETGKWRHILLGGVMVGVAFNVKMMQAYLIVPALYALYFFGTHVSWRRKVVQLAATTALLLAVSVSWALAVDLTPADQRPYVGSSETNSVLELAFGYNGVDRILGGSGSGSHDGSTSHSSTAADSTSTRSSTHTDGSAGGSSAGGSSNSGEVGQKGITRLFETALANELAWLLPFGLLSIGVLVIRTKITLPLRREHQAVMLWGGWLATGIVFFSISSHFHAYYLATLAPALAALVGIGMVTLWNIAQEKRALGLFLTLSLVIVTLLGQHYIISLYNVGALWSNTLLVVSLITGGASLALIWSYRHAHPFRPLMWVLVAVILAVPTLWSLETAQTAGSSVTPVAYAGDTHNKSGSGGSGSSTDTATSVADYISEYGGNATYDLVVSSSMTGSSIVLDTDLDVLYLGGFKGDDHIYTAEMFAEMAKDGTIEFVLDSGSQSEISTWVAATCTQVDVTLSGATSQPAGGRSSHSTLYDCSTAS